MNKLEQAARQALEALVRAEALYGQPNADIQTAIREARAEQSIVLNDPHPPHRLCECTACLEYWTPLPDCDAFAGGGKPIDHIPDATKMVAPEGYALISIEALKAWGKYDEVRSACRFPAEPAIPEWVDVDDYEEPVTQEPVAWHHPECEGECIACLIERCVKDSYGTQGLDFMLRHINAAPVQPVKQEPVSIGNSSVSFPKELDATNKWIVDYNFLNKIYDMVRFEGVSTNLPAIEAVLIAVENIYAAPVKPVKQEPAAFVSDIESGRPLMCDLDEWHQKGLTALYAAPVDAKAIRSEALEEAAKWFEDEEHPLQPKKVAAAIRRLK